MSTDDRMETITDPAEIRATDEPDERGDFPCCATPAPVGAGLDLDAMARRYSTATDDEVIYEMYPALEAEVRRLTESRSTVAANLAASLLLAENRAESAEAEVVTLRARLAEVESLVNNGQTVGWIERDGDVAWIAADAIRAALATTGEGEHVAREVFTADGIPFVRCSCTNAKSPTSPRWLTEHVPNGGLAELQAVVKLQAEGAKA